ncbi:MAG: hypothetical protein ACD_25C00163G0001 [uncultured bacterium]|nr:MAG: hypothetical protein ACD_25C00163G0001 [uncultured bacterium]
MVTSTTLLIALIPTFDNLSLTSAGESFIFTLSITTALKRGTKELSEIVTFNLSLPEYFLTGSVFLTHSEEKPFAGSTAISSRAMPKIDRPSPLFGVTSISKTSSSIIFSTLKACSDKAFATSLTPAFVFT